MSTYEFSEAGVKYSTPDNQPIVLAWSTMKGVQKPLFSAHLRLRGREGVIPLPQNEQELKSFLLRFFSAWRDRDLDAAKKNAFDYVDSKKAFAKVQLVISVVFSLGLSFLLIGDSLEQRHCSQQLRLGTTPGFADIVKLKRKRAGHYILDLSLSVGGKTYLGQDQVISLVDYTPQPPIPVLYAKNDPGCFAIAKIENPAEADWAKRRFFTSYLFFFGLFFLVAGAWGTVTAAARLIEKRPATDAVCELFGFQL